MSQVKKYKAEVVSIVNPVDNIYTVELKSLSGKFKYLPGQFLHLAMDEYDPSQGWPESRCFSMQSSPSDENIKLTFSVKGSFTTRMANELAAGKVIDIKLPYGEFFQQEHSKDNVVFIAGGTGITPFLSIFNNPLFKEYINPHLYFGLRNNSHNIYNFYLSTAQNINQALKIEIRCQDTEGILDIEGILNKHGAFSTYFISGSQVMIELFKNKLAFAGVPLMNVKTDEWG